IQPGFHQVRGEAIGIIKQAFNIIRLMELIMKLNHLGKYYPPLLTHPVIIVQVVFKKSKL
ncbi:MAG: hypothetical protein ACK42B_07510, partial [Chitinophagaceae bacterium]